MLCFLPADTDVMQRSGGHFVNHTSRTSWNCRKLTKVGRGEEKTLSTHMVGFCGLAPEMTRKRRDLAVCAPEITTQPMDLAVGRHPGGKNRALEQQNSSGTMGSRC